MGPDQQERLDQRTGSSAEAVGQENRKGSAGRCEALLVAFRMGWAAGLTEAVPVPNQRQGYRLDLARSQQEARKGSYPCCLHCYRCMYQNS